MLGAVDGAAVVSLWHSLGAAGRLVLAVDEPLRGRLAARRLDGASVALEGPAAAVQLPVDGRRTLLTLPGVSPAAARRLLAQARWEPQR